MEQFNQLHTKLDQIWAVSRSLEGNPATVLESLSHGAKELLKQVETAYQMDIMTKAVPDDYVIGSEMDPACLSFPAKKEPIQLVLHEMDVYELIERIHGPVIRLHDDYTFADYQWGVDTFELTPDRIKLSQLCRDALLEVIGLNMRSGVHKAGIRKRAMELWAALMLAETPVDVENRKADYLRFIEQTKAGIDAWFAATVDGVLLFEQKLAH